MPDITKTFVDTVKEVFKTTTNKIPNLDIQLADLTRFMFIEKGILQISIGIIVGFIIMQLTFLLVDDLISPIIYRFFNDPNKTMELKHYNKVIFGVNFHIGKIINDLLKVSISGYVIYTLYLRMINKN